MVSHRVRALQPYREGSEKTARKEEGWVVFKSMRLFPSKAMWVDPPSKTDTPLLHPQTSYYTSCTQTTQMGEQGGSIERGIVNRRTFQAGEGGLKKDGAVIVKEMVGSHATRFTMQMRLMPFLKLKHNSTTTCCQVNVRRQTTFCLRKTFSLTE